MLTPLQDCVQIGGIDCGEGRCGEERVDDFERIARVREHGLQRTVVGTVAAARMHHLPAHQVDDRDD